MRRTTCNHVVPKHDLCEAAPFEALDAEMVEVAMVVAQEADNLLRVHLEGDHETFENELSGSQRLIELLRHLNIIQVSLAASPPKRSFLAQSDRAQLSLLLWESLLLRHLNNVGLSGGNVWTLCPVPGCLLSRRPVL